MDIDFLRMKKLLFILAAFVSSTMSFAQVKGVVVEEVDNAGAVAGRTYRIYIELTNDSDAVHMVYGDANHPLEIKSTKPFYQSTQGGPLSSNINRKMAKENAQVRYDSFLTIGYLDNYENAINQLLDLTEFEKSGGAVRTNDGAWYCLPGKPQTYAGSGKRVLIMQITTEGKVSGKFSIMGKTASKEVFHSYDHSFSCGR